MDPHWDGVYARGDRDRSWYQESAATSLELIGAATLPGRSLVDVGGGASTLVDGALAAGCSDVTVVDVSDTGMAIARERLGAAAERVTWVVADVRSWEPGRTFDVWHDRAVLHFLVEPADRAAYVATLRRATHPGSTVVIGVFGPNGPESCSGLPVQRYGPVDLAVLLGSDFVVLRDLVQRHETPAGAVQEFCWIEARRTAVPEPPETVGGGRFGPAGP